jgi:hypothetical protein
MSHSLDEQSKPMSIEKESSSNGKGIDRAFDTFIVIQTLIFATIFSYLAWLNKPENLVAVTKVTRVFFIPLVIIIFLWIFGHLFDSTKVRLVLKTLAWYWSFLSFFIQSLFLGAILLLDILSPQVTIFFLLAVTLLTMFFAALININFRKVFGGSYSLRIQVLSAILAVISMVIFMVFVLRTA